MELTEEEIHLVRQWFGSVQDLSGCLEKEDYVLAKKIYEVLGMRVPKEVKDKT
jgi:hypothetical protein